jgi:branched-subunit amino acid ABC-type transport system permease component
VSSSSFLRTLLSGALLGCFYALVASGFALTLGVNRALNRDLRPGWA